MPSSALGKLSLSDSKPDVCLPYFHTSAFVTDLFKVYLPEKQENDAPPNYTATTPIDNGPVPEEITAAFANLNISDDPPEFPTADHCLVHLKLLNAIHALKEDIGYTDGLFGLWDSRVETAGLDAQVRDKALAKTREKRWSLYLARAVARFEEWWVLVLCPREHGTRLLGKDMVEDNAAFTQFTSQGVVRKFTTAMLPPLGKSTNLTTKLSANKWQQMF